MARLNALSIGREISNLLSADRRAQLARVGERLETEAFYLAAGVRAGMLSVEPPHRLVQMLRALHRFGLLAGPVSVAAITHPDQLAIIDERGEITYRELDVRSNAIANAWIEQGLQAGHGVAIMARNHRGFVEALMAAAKCGARAILLNTGFSAPQVKEVADREGVDLLVCDEEFEAELERLEFPLGRYRAWVDSRYHAPDTLDALASSGRPDAPAKPAVAPRIVILTSGTTGTPKGAGRDVPISLSPIGGPLSKVPYRAGETTQICAPLFHALGFSQGLLAMALHCTLVLHRRFDPLEVIDSIERDRVTTVVLVPVMLQRLLSIDPAELAARDTSHLRIIYLSGSQLGPALAQRARAVFGDVLYNLYGSTEVAYATIATPEDLVAEPGCVGRVVRGAVVKIVDESGEEMPVGRTGRIFVGNLLEFEGYTGGEDKERMGRLVASGDIGHLDVNGRLFIDGRDDDMIISGGENVFPGEIEDLLAMHPDIVEVAALGVPDEEFGQRLKVFVVPRPDSELTVDAVRDYVRVNLARYKVPREVRFLDALPRNPTGKVLKRELAEIHD